MNKVQLRQKLQAIIDLEHNISIGKNKSSITEHLEIERSNLVDEIACSDGIVKKLLITLCVTESDLVTNVNGARKLTLERQRNTLMTEIIEKCGDDMPYDTCPYCKNFPVVMCEDCAGCCDCCKCGDDKRKHDL